MFFLCRYWLCRRFNMFQHHGTGGDYLPILQGGREVCPFPCPAAGIVNPIDSIRGSPGRTTTIDHCQQPTSWVRDSLQSHKLGHSQTGVIRLGLRSCQRASHCRGLQNSALQSNLAGGPRQLRKLQHSSSSFFWAWGAAVRREEADYPTLQTTASNTQTKVPSGFRYLSPCSILHLNCHGFFSLQLDAAIGAFPSSTCVGFFPLMNFSAWSFLSVSRMD